MAKEIYDWCVAHEAWEDACIYFNGKAWATWDEWNGENGKKIGGSLYEYENKCCTDYFKYGNPSTLSMSFEGGLYTIFNAFWENETWTRWYDEFVSGLFDKYGGFIELGDSYNFTFVED